MPCLITALTRSAIKKITRKKNNEQQNKQKKFYGRNQISELKST